MSTRHTDQITIRMLDRNDGEALRQLAERDGARIPAQPVLGALHDDRLLAAVGVGEAEAVIADPFEPTAGAVELLRTRMHQLRSTVRPAERSARRAAPRRSRAALAGSPPGGGRTLQL